MSIDTRTLGCMSKHAILEHCGTALHPMLIRYSLYIYIYSYQRPHLMCNLYNNGALVVWRRPRMLDKIINVAHTVNM